MTRPFPHREPCAKCGQPHPARIAGDGGVTYRHPDGHPYTPQIGEPEHADSPVRVATLPSIREKWQRVHGYSPALFGALVKCDVCRCVLEADAADLVAHAQLCHRKGAA